MKQGHSFFSRKLIGLKLIPFVCLLTVGMICVGLVPKETRAPEKFPETDLVFTSSGGVGFVNADGSELAYLDFSSKIPGATAGSESVNIARPVITGNNRALVAKVDTTFSYVYMTNPNLLVLWHAGKYPIYCSQWGSQYLPLLAKDQNQILINFDQRIESYDLDSCGTDDEPLALYEEISGMPSPDLRYIVRPVDPFDRIIVISDLENGEERTIGMGDYPAWSQDSDWLAYTGEDGIYIVNVVKKTDPIRVLIYPNPVGEIHPTYSDINQIPPPEPLWSPDGKWLVYHRLTADINGSTLPDYFSIFKVSIESGEEIKVVDRGMYPYWRWPVEKP